MIPDGHTLTRTIYRTHTFRGSSGTQRNPVPANLKIDKFEDFFTSCTKEETQASIDGLARGSGECRG